MFPMWRQWSHRMILSGKRGSREVVSASLFPQSQVGAALPVAELSVDSTMRVALVDSGCSQCIVYEPCCVPWQRKNVSVVTFNGQKQNCEGVGHIRLQVRDGDSVEVDAFVTNFKPLAFECVLRLNGYKSLAGVTILPPLDVRFGSLNSNDREDPGKKLVCAAAMEVVEPDFRAVYDDSKTAWIVAWKWAGDSEPNALWNTVTEYTVASSAQVEYESEIKE